MTTTDGLADDAAIEGEGSAAEEAEEEGPPYGKLDPETAAKCGLWLE